MSASKLGGLGRIGLYAVVDGVGVAGMSDLELDEDIDDVDAFFDFLSFRSYLGVDVDEDDNDDVLRDDLDRSEVEVVLVLELAMLSK